MAKASGSGTGRAVQTSRPTPDRDLYLAGATAGQVVRIAMLAAGQAANRRLTEMGLRSGTVVEVMQNHGLDGVIVGLGSERLALPRSLALRIRIDEGPQVADSAATSSATPMVGGAQ